MYIKVNKIMKNQKVNATYAIESELESAMNKLKELSTTKSAKISLIANSKSLFSYPTGNYDENPNLVHLIKLAEKYKIDMRVILLIRNPIDTIHSTLSSNIKSKQRIIKDEKKFVEHAINSIKLLYSHISSISHNFYICLDYDSMIQPNYNYNYSPLLNFIHPDLNRNDSVVSKELLTNFFSMNPFKNNNNNTNNNSKINIKDNYQSDDLHQLYDEYAMIMKKLKSKC